MVDPVEPDESPRHIGIAAGVTYTLMIALGWFWLWLRERSDRIPGAATGDYDLWGSAGLGLGVGLGVSGGFAVAIRYIPACRRLQERLLAVLGPLDEAQIIALAFFSGLGEEFFFRLAMQDAVGPVWSTLIFGLLHTGPGGLWLWTVLALGIGALFAWMIELGCGLLSVTAAHCLINYLSLRRMYR